MARMTGFVFQDEYLSRLHRLTDEELGRLVRALAAYHISGATPELGGAEGMAFDFIRPDIDRIEEQYRVKCETNRRNRLSPDGVNAGDKNEKGRPSTTVPQDKDKAKDQAIHDDHHPADTEERPSEDNVLAQARQALNGLTATHERALQAYRDTLGDALVSYAIDRTVANGAWGWGYTEAILQNYARQGFRTVGEAQAADARHRSGRGPRLLRAQDYAQREYREDEMREILGVHDLFRAG